MREILFKAKRKDNGYWIEGGYAEHDGKIFIVIWVRYIPDTRDWDTADYYENNPHYNSSLVEVIPETVCQYTGMTDRDGKKIFENDIVHDVESWKPSENGVVKFGIGTFSSGIHQYTGWVIENENKKTENSPLYQYETGDFGEKIGFLVIGNIFDNPELINANGGGKDE